MNEEKEEEDLSLKYSVKIKKYADTVYDPVNIMQTYRKIQKSIKVTGCIFFDGNVISESTMCRLYLYFTTKSEPVNMHIDGKSTDSFLNYIFLLESYKNSIKYYPLYNSAEVVDKDVNKAYEYKLNEEETDMYLNIICSPSAYKQFIESYKYTDNSSSTTTSYLDEQLKKLNNEE